MNNKRLVRGALLVALALALQSLRLVLPLPQPASTFVIGSLVHMMLALTLKLCGLGTASLLGFLLPLTAYVQGQVLLVFLIPVIWLGNLLFVLLVHCFTGQRRLVLVIPPVAKALVMFAAAWCVVGFVAMLAPAVRKAILFAMSVPQLVTALLGILLARQVLLRIRNF